MVTTGLYVERKTVRKTKNEFENPSITCISPISRSNFQSSMTAMSTSCLRLLRTTKPCNAGRTVRCYSESVYQIAQQKWQLGGVPKPKSILEDDDAPVDLSEDNDAVTGAQSSSMTLSPYKNCSCKPTPLEVARHREAIRKSFPEGWSPPRKLSREDRKSVV